MDTDNGRFQYAVSVVLEHEGGLSNNKNDRGGITKYGVSLRYLELERMDINGDGIIDDKDVRGLTKQEASDIFRKYWWEKYGYNLIKDLRLATKVFDLAVNMGGYRAHKLLQQAVGCVVDGILGPKTLIATNSLNAGSVLAQLRLEARQFYLELVDDKPKYKVFIKGWLRRANW